jgi:hypothetical protein
MTRKNKKKDHQTTHQRPITESGYPYPTKQTNASGTRSIEPQIKHATHPI